MQFSWLSRLKQREETMSLFFFALWMAVRNSDYLGWGHWFTLTNLELATNCFAKDNVLCVGGYGVVYHGRLSNGTSESVMKILFFIG
jgi:hypothetical protein